MVMISLLVAARSLVGIEASAFDGFGRLLEGPYSGVGRQVVRKMRVPISGLLFAKSRFQEVGRSNSKRLLKVEDKSGATAFILPGRVTFIEVTACV